MPSAASLDPSFRSVVGRHLPGLDGLRAMAILGVIAYHLGLGWMAGGYLGVDLFFVLSGFLITSLLVEEGRGEGRVRLGSFWARRARRLLPALVLTLVAVCVFAALTSTPGAPVDFRQLRGDALATLLYVANWRQVFQGHSYFAQFAAPSPLLHTWSLSIEEQFYLLWPLAVVAALAYGRRRSAAAGSGSRSGTGLGAPWRRAGLAVSVGGTLASAGWMAFLAHHGGSLSHLYYGTDVRAFDLLAGCATAMLTAARPQPGPGARRALHVASVAGAAVLGVFWWRAATSGGEPGAWMFDGGFLLCAVGAAVVIADARLVEPGPLARLLSLRPLVWIGTVSYGLYLWHWPVIVFGTPARLHLNGAVLQAAQVAITFAIATASFYLVERPLRRFDYRRLPAMVRRGLAPAGLAAAAAGVVVATIPPAANWAPPLISAATVSAGSGAAGASLHATVDPLRQIPIRLPAGLGTRHDPLRVMLVGDSEMFIQAPAVRAALGWSGAAVVQDVAWDGWGLSRQAYLWRQRIPQEIAQFHPQIVVATWGWDNDCVAPGAMYPGPPPACRLDDPSSYAQLLASFVRVVLAPGDGVDGLVFEEYPPLGPPPALVGADAASQAAQRTLQEQVWDGLARSMAGKFPGKVMYFPVGRSVELKGNGDFQTWLPADGDPSAPRSTWIRVRSTDNTHLCPAGLVLWEDALLADLQPVVPLPAPPANWGTWSWTRDPITSDEGRLSCPNDHPS